MGGQVRKPCCVADVSWLQGACIDHNYRKRFPEIQRLLILVCVQESRERPGKPMAENIANVLNNLRPSVVFS
jgi:hypothetical protein